MHYFDYIYIPYLCILYILSYICIYSILFVLCKHTLHYNCHVYILYIYYIIIKVYYLPIFYIYQSFSWYYLNINWLMVNDEEILFIRYMNILYVLLCLNYDLNRLLIIQVSMTTSIQHSGHTFSVKSFKRFDITFFTNSFTLYNYYVIEVCTRRLPHKQRLVMLRN